MAYPQTAPCVNINDEVVQVVSVNVREGEFVTRGHVIGAVETDKSLVDVIAEQDGYVLRIECTPEQKVRVGSIMVWLGDTADEAVPEAAPAILQRSSTDVEPTAKARAMLKDLDIDPAGIPAAGERLTVADIEAWLAGSGGKGASANRASTTRRVAEGTPSVPGELQDLSADAAGMLRTVLWHRDRAAAAYLELEYDPTPWEEHAARYAAAHNLMLSPLLPLLAFRLATIARDTPGINATIIDDQRYQYTAVNVGFTVQAGQTLYLGVVRDTQHMDVERFIEALGEMQRRAMAHKLGPEETSGATLSFSSMARWNVSRHIPILPPHTSLIVAHAAPKGSGRAVLGASYDHRLLSGFDVVQVLQTLSRPPA